MEKGINMGNWCEKYNVKVGGKYLDLGKCNYEEMKSILNCVSSRKVRGKEGKEYWGKRLNEVKEIRDKRFGVRKGGKGNKCSYEYSLDEIKKMSIDDCKKRLNSVNSKICYCKDKEMMEKLEKVRDWYKGRIKFLKMKEERENNSFEKLKDMFE